MSASNTHTENSYQDAPEIPLKENLQSSTALQPPAPPRTVMDYIKGTLQYIGENPIQFALNVGVGMAVSFGVKAGLIAMGLGLGPIGLAIGAAMITSVILNVGRKLWKGEEIKLEDIAGKSLFSGIFAGIIGGIFGSGLGDYLNESFKDIPSGNPNAELPEGVTDLAESAKTQTGNSLWVEADKSHTLDQLLATGKGFFTFAGESRVVDGITHQPLQYVTRQTLENIARDIENAHNLAGLPQPEHVIIHNDPIMNAAFEATTFDPKHGHYVHLNTGLLAESKDVVKYITDHEIGHGVNAFERPLDYQIEKIFHPSHFTEYSADAFALREGNYKGALESFTHMAQIQNHALSAWIGDLQEGSLNPERVLEITKTLKIEIDTDILNSGNTGRIQEALAEKLKAINVLDLVQPGDPHPAIRERMLEVLKHAAVDEKLNATQFEAQLTATQAQLNATPALHGKINLMDEWHAIKEKAISGEDVGIAAKEVTRNYSLAFSGDPVLEQVGHLPTHAPNSHVGRLLAQRSANKALGRGLNI